MLKISTLSWLCVVCLALTSEALDRIGLPVVDISTETKRHVFVARGTKTTWNGHCSTVLLPDGKTIYCVWSGRRDGTRRHEGPVGFMKRSDDGGPTWSDELALPPNWAEIGRGAPTIHRLVDGRGKARMYVFCRTQARPTFLQGISEDDGKTWSELRPVATAPPESGPITGWTGPMTIVEATAPDGRRRHLMWYERARGVDQGPEPGVIWQSASYDGGLTWGESKPIVDRAGACEPACVRSPDGKQLLLLIRDESRQANSLMATSHDEGETWSPPRELPLALTGDRFLPRYAPDGRLVILFRPVPHKLPRGTLKAPWDFPDGHCTAWVGRYEDLVAGREGECLIRLLRSHRGADHTYPGLELLPDGTFVATTYIKYRPGDDELHSVVSVRFKMDEIDAGKTRTRAAADRSAAPPRWNILFVFADDWGRYAFCYRGLDGRPGLNDVVATPAIDRLAREGVLFRNAVGSSPSCTPCRSSLLFGRPFFACGRGAILLNAVWLLDSRLVVASGDHGMPGVPAGKCELHDHGTAFALVARVSGGTPGRIVDDFVSLLELAPRFWRSPACRGRPG